MPYYLVPFVRPDGRSRGRRPRGYDHASHNFITLGKGEGARALIWFDEPFADRHADKLADGGPEALALTTRAKLENLVKDREYCNPAQPFEQAIVGILKRPPLPWHMTALRPSLNRGRYEIWLGPGGRGRNLFHEEPIDRVLHSKAWADNFNRANGALVGSTSSGGGFTWTQVEGINNLWTTTSNRARVAGVANGDDEIVGTDTDADTDDLFTQVNLVTYSRPTDTEVAARVYTGANFSSGLVSGYMLRFANGQDYGERLIRAISTEVDLDIDDTVTTSGVMRIESDGSTKTAYLNGVAILGPATDTSQATGSGSRRCGFGVSYDEDGGSGTAVVEFEDFVGGDLVQSAPISIVMHQLHEQGIA